MADEDRKTITIGDFVEQLLAENSDKEISDWIAQLKSTAFNWRAHSKLVLTACAAENLYIRFCSLIAQSMGDAQTAQRILLAKKGRVLVNNLRQKAIDAGVSENFCSVDYFRPIERSATIG